MNELKRIGDLLSFIVSFIVDLLLMTINNMMGLISISILSALSFSMPYILYYNCSYHPFIVLINLHIYMNISLTKMLH